MLKNENNRSSSSKFGRWRRLQERRRIEQERKLRDGRYHPDLGLKLTNSLQRRRLLRKTVPLLVLFGVSTLVSFYAVLPLSRMCSLNVSGGDRQTRMAVIRASGLHYYESLLSIWPDRRRIEGRITDRVGNVKSARLSVSGFNHVKVTIREYPTIGYVERNNMYYKLPSSGVAVDYGVLAPSGSVPVFYGFGSGRLKKVALQVRDIDGRVRGCISEIHYEPSKVDPDRIHAYMNDGNEVIARIPTFSKKMNYYPQYTAGMKFKGIIDLEVGAFAYPRH